MNMDNFEKELAKVEDRMAKHYGMEDGRTLKAFGYTEQARAAFEKGLTLLARKYLQMGQELAK